METVLCGILGYLFGCFSTSYFIAKAKGFDIHEKGSGNAGASNVMISLGWKYGILTALIDILKGFLAVTAARKLYPANVSAPFIAGCFAVLGHIFPFYLKFKGGKGYATYTGMILALNWKLAVGLMLWGVAVTLVTDYIAIATISTCILVPVYFALQKTDALSLLLLTITSLIMIYKHKINIIRLIHHEEIGLRNNKKHRVNLDEIKKEEA